MKFFSKNVSSDFPRLWGHAHCRTLGNVLEEGLAVEKRNIKDKKDIILDLNKELELYRCSFSRVSKMLDDFQGCVIEPGFVQLWVLSPPCFRKGESCEKKQCRTGLYRISFSCDKENEYSRCEPVAARIWFGVVHMSATQAPLS